MLFCFKKHIRFGYLLSLKQSQTRQVKSMRLNTGLLHDAIVKTKKQWHFENNHGSYLEFSSINNLLYSPITAISGIQCTGISNHLGRMQEKNNSKWQQSYAKVSGKKNPTLCIR